MKSNSLIAVLCGLGALAFIAFIDYQQYNYNEAPNSKAVITANSLLFGGGKSVLAKNPNNGVSPANILFFETERVGTETLLFWDATDELELVGYQVEKSIGEGPFERIGWVYSREISREPSYEFMDTSTLTEEPCFYRLKMVDFDGAEAYSPIISAPATDH